MGEKIMAQPKVSIIIPIWNTEKYLEKCLSSVVNQTLKGIEIICVNNGSTDSSIQIIEKFVKNDPRIKVVTKEHGCLSSARNAGMAVATAPYITFVDSDDWVEPECYELAIAEFEKDPDIDLVCWGANIINVDLDEKSSYIKSAQNYHKIKFVGEHSITDGTILNSTVCVWNKMFKTDIIKDKKVSFPIDVELEDNSFFFCYIIHCKKAYYLNKYLYNYVQRKNSGFEKICSGTSPIIAPRLKNVKNIIKYYQKFNVLEHHLKVIQVIFRDYFRADYRTALPENKTKVLEKATEIALLLNNVLKDNIIVTNLINKNYEQVLCIIFKRPIKLWGNSLLGIFTIPNSNRYIIKILGIKISVKLNKKGMK